MRDNTQWSKPYNRQSRGGDTKAVDSHEPIQARPLEVKVGDNFDKAFKIFRSIVQKERVISTFKERQSYEKPSVRRRRKRAESQQKRNEAGSKGRDRDRDDKPRIKVLKEQKRETETLQ
jgi:small subunit ribosomal protein S21